MNDSRAWYYADGDKTMGPHTLEELCAFIAQGIVTPHTYIIREDMPEWRLLSEFPDILAMAQRVDRRAQSPRAPIFELVVAHNDKHVAFGTLRNISVTGVFFETRDKVFRLNEEVKLTLKEGKGLGKPMHLRGVVVRIADDNQYPQGYGLELKGIDLPTRERIAQYIQWYQQNIG